MRLRDYLTVALAEEDEDPTKDPKYEIVKWMKVDMRTSSGLFDIRKEGNEYVIDTKSSFVIRLDELPKGDDDMVYLPHQFGEADASFTFVNKHDKLKNLKGCPNRVDGDFLARGCGLESLEGGPNVVTGKYDVSDNRFTTWEGFPGHVGELRLTNSKITSFTGISKNVNFCSTIVFNPLQITSGVLELLDIEMLEEVMMPGIGVLSMNDGDKYEDLIHIINKHLGDNGSRDIFDLQSDLIDAGYESFTKK